MFYQILIFLFATKTALNSCNYEVRTLDFEKQKFKIERIGKLDPMINESSGVIPSPWSENLLTINDSGGEPVLYEVNKKGELIEVHPVPGARNIDWEELAVDDKGNIYIGDFGNNKSKRKNLTVYKYKNGETTKINFRFADQTFDENAVNEYDCEAFFWENDSLYIFTKSWVSGKKKSRLYVSPDHPGTYDLYPKDEITIRAQVTGADISPSNDSFVLINYGKIFFFKIEDGNINFKHPQWCVSMAKSQTEAIMYENENTILFTNEQRRIFRMHLLNQE